MQKTSTLITILAILVTLTTVAPTWAAGDPKVVNINRADASQLALLPRVGPALAGRILEFREANGKFERTEDLILVRGIGDKTFELLEPYVTVSGETTLTKKVKAGEAQQRLEENDEGGES